ncbi:MAG: hypothetical protein AAGA80_17350, partial [Cyanobacteria bacterium P01_F01_bin.143]
FILIIILIISIFILRPYNKHRPGTFLFSAIIFVMLAVSYFCLYSLPNSFSIEDITILSLNLAELIYISIFFAWIVFTVLYILNSGLGLLILSYLKGKIGLVSFQKLRNARLISVIALSFPGLLFLMITLPLWSALNRIGSNLITDIDDYSPIYMEGLHYYIQLQLDGKLGQSCSSNSDCFLQVISDFAATPFSSVFIVIFIFTVLIALWTLLPALITELVPPDSDNQATNQDYSSYLSFDLGQWITKGYEITIVVLNFLICTIAPILFGIALLLGFNNLLGWIELTWLSPENVINWLNITAKIQNYSAVLIAASAGSLLAFSARLNKISLGIRSVLDAALDVDNYLRLYPREDNPRARIYARYFSLLKYICDRPKEKQYDAIVIVSHSQGTVISADLLRFLNYLEIGKDFNIPNIYLFTMGSPIRQLYGFAFPHLYHWVYNEQSPSDNKNINPDPSELLNVKQWVNAYRSGDYIGRYLWRSPDDNDLWMKVEFDPNLEEDKDKNVFRGQYTNNPQVTSREFCIGAGAHTHYWDETAPDIAHEIDRLIKEAEKK